MIGVCSLIRSKSSRVSGTSASAAIASRCSTALVDPPVAAVQMIPFSIALRVRISRGRVPRCSACIKSSPLRRPTSFLRGSVAPTLPLPSGAIPMNSITMAMVFAVYCAPHAPAPGQATSSIAVSSAALMVPAASCPTPSNTSWMVMSCPLYRPGAIDPLYSTTPGMFNRASAIGAAGIVLSHPTMITAASKAYPTPHNSSESAITSRLISDAFIPSVPMAMPSLIEIVFTSIGVPPAARTPAITSWARARWL